MGVVLTAECPQLFELKFIFVSTYSIAHDTLTR